MKVNALLDHLIKLGNVKNDAGLARALKVLPPVISKIRHGALPLGPSVIIRAHEAFGISVADIKSIAGLESIPALRRPTPFHAMQVAA